MENIPDDAEFLDINDYYTLNTNILWEKKPLTRTACSYLIKKQTCEKILSDIIPFESAIDHELNNIFMKYKIINYWSNQSLIHHGSSNVYHSSY